MFCSSHILPKYINFKDLSLKNVLKIQTCEYNAAY